MHGANVTITAEISKNSYPGKSVLHGTVVTVTAQVSQSSYLRVHPCMVQLSHTTTAEVRALTLGVYIPAIHLSHNHSKGNLP